MVSMAHSDSGDVCATHKTGALEFGSLPEEDTGSSDSAGVLAFSCLQKEDVAADTHISVTATPPSPPLSSASLLPLEGLAGQGLPRPPSAIPEDAGALESATCPEEKRGQPGDIETTGDPANPNSAGQVPNDTGLFGNQSSHSHCPRAPTAAGEGTVPKAAQSTHRPPKGPGSSPATATGKVECLPQRSPSLLCCEPLPRPLAATTSLVLRPPAPDGESTDWKKVGPQDDSDEADPPLRLVIAIPLPRRAQLVLGLKVLAGLLLVQALLFLAYHQGVTAGQASVVTELQGLQMERDVARAALAEEQLRAQQEREAARSHGGVQEQELQSLRRELEEERARAQRRVKDLQAVIAVQKHEVRMLQTELQREKDSHGFTFFNVLSHGSALASAVAVLAALLARRHS